MQENDIDLNSPGCPWEREWHAGEVQYHGGMHVYREMHQAEEWGAECAYRGGNLVMGNPPESGTADYWPDGMSHLLFDPGGPRILGEWLYGKYWQSHPHPFPFKD